MLFGKGKPAVADVVVNQCLVDVDILLGHLQGPGLGLRLELRAG